MNTVSLEIICILSFVTSLISGVFGMAGGMLLMGALPLLLPLPQAIFLHGIIQGFANGARAFQLRNSVSFSRVSLLRNFHLYLIGTIVAYVLLRKISYIPSPFVMYLSLGALAFSAAIKGLPDNIQFGTKIGAFLCGFFVNGTAFVVGVSGPMLELFVRNKQNKKEEVIFAKAVIQVVGHLAKVFLMGEILWRQDIVRQFEGGSLVILLVFSAFGTYCGKIILTMLSQEHFYKYTGIILWGMGITYVARAILALSI